MQFTPKCKIVQSADATTLKIIDDSNYDDNSDNITPGDVLTRTVVIRDANDEIVDTVLLDLIDDDGQYYNTFAIATDGYWTFEMILTFVSIDDETTTTAYLATRYYKNKYADYTGDCCGSDCNCQSSDTCTNLTWAQRFFNTAEIKAERGDGLVAQNNILAASRLIDQLPTCNC